MKQYLKTLFLAAAWVAMSFGGAASAQTSVGVSVQVAQPGVYGRIDIGNMPPPPVVYAKPVVIAQPAVVVPAQPVYLYVPPGHQKKWSKHCHRYNACGQPVYFVRESWVHERYEREHGHKHGKKDKSHKGHGKD
ncbi:hypothetical protein LRS03_19195 [Rhizobacter sp. J219]|jgi:hypothetical protein|uniref:hypothetical protein n=1 Tax=Rhizobacter sp. J219 TaxID=2898430 RepID=UPI00215155E4|nr:hypothetical protein [Rhizobacter sp. J219]MCR5884868.1 hypothetical protein [Rhizobacter sp. J219]